MRPKLLNSTVVALSRPGAESSFTPKEGNPKECKTSLLVTKIRATSPKARGIGVSNALSSSSFSESKR